MLSSNWSKTTERLKLKTMTGRSHTLASILKHDFLRGRWQQMLILFLISWKLVTGANYLGLAIQETSHLIWFRKHCSSLYQTEKTVRATGKRVYWTTLSVNDMHLNSALVWTVKPLSLNQRNNINFMFLLLHYPVDFITWYVFISCLFISVVALILS